MPDYLRQPAAWFHTRILVGPGSFLRPGFVHQHKITHVINCAFNEDSPAWFREVNPKRYVCLEATDTLDSNLHTWFPTFESTMHKFLQEGNGTVYVHCQAGINRSAFLALLYIIKNFHIDPPAAVQSTQKQRPCMFTNPAFRRQVEEFINGRISSEKDTGIVSNDSVYGNIRFDSSGDSTQSQRNENHAWLSNGRA